MMKATQNSVPKHRRIHKHKSTMCQDTSSTVVYSRAHVVRRAAQSERTILDFSILPTKWNRLCESKINDLQVAVSGDEKVFWLEVSICVALVVNVLQSHDDHGGVIGGGLN